jgi:hypothetical protein
MDKPVVRLALLSTDHEDMEGYEASLRTLFEQTVTRIGHFSWEIDNPRLLVNHGGRDHYDDGDKHAVMMHVQIPKRMERDVSLFQELFVNTYANREFADPDINKTFTLALFEVVPVGKQSYTLGRVKLITNVTFARIGIGSGTYGGQDTVMPLARYHDIPVDWKSIPERPAYIPPLADEEGTSTFTISGRELIANAKARQRLSDMAHAMVQTISAAEPKAKAPAKK